MHSAHPERPVALLQPVSIFLAHAIPLFLISLFLPICISGNFPLLSSRILTASPANATADTITDSNISLRSIPYNPFIPAGPESIFDFV